jgi:NAD-dependent deacetylase
MRDATFGERTQDPTADAATLIRSARYLTAFTGAGISVESGIPPFRGEGGLWSKYDPRMLELDYFLAHPDKAWPVIKEIFYDHFSVARPNRAHEVLAAWERDGWPRAPGSAGTGAGNGAPDSAASPAPAASERRGYLKLLITQNIDNLHFDAGSRDVVEFHGNSRTLACMSCGGRVGAESRLLESLPPRCPCGGIYKPDFIFFGEGIPPAALSASEHAALETDVMLVIGSTGEVYPAAAVPRRAKQHGARIIEINPSESAFTTEITDLFIPREAGKALDLLDRELSRDQTKKKT